MVQSLMCQTYQKNRNPLVVRVVERAPVVFTPDARALEVRRDVEGGVHPAVRLQNGLIDSATSLKKLGRKFNFVLRDSSSNVSVGLFA